MACGNHTWRRREIVSCVACVRCGLDGRRRQRCLTTTTIADVAAAAADDRRWRRDISAPRERVSCMQQHRSRGVATVSSSSILRRQPAAAAALLLCPECTPAARLFIVVTRRALPPHYTSPRRPAAIDRVEEHGDRDCGLVEGRCEIRRGDLGLGVRIHSSSGHEWPSNRRLTPAPKRRGGPVTLVVRSASRCVYISAIRGRFDRCPEGWPRCRRWRRTRSSRHPSISRTDFSPAINIAERARSQRARSELK